MSSFLDLLLVLPAMLIAITVHEFSHGMVADALGDPTPRQSGRLSLNPLVHLDLLGSLMIIIAHFGWAKPVPVNARYFKDPKRDMLLVGVAGPVANFVTAFVFALVLRLGLLSSIGIISGIFLYLFCKPLFPPILNLVTKRFVRPLSPDIYHPATSTSPSWREPLWAGSAGKIFPYAQGPG